MNNSKPWYLSKVNFAAFLGIVMTLGTIAVKLPPELSHWAPYLTTAALFATIIFRTFFTDSTLTFPGSSSGSVTKVLIAGALLGLLASGCATANISANVSRACDIYREAKPVIQEIVDAANVKVLQPDGTFVSILPPAIAADLERAKPYLHALDQAAVAGCELNNQSSGDWKKLDWNRGLILLIGLANDAYRWHVAHPANRPAAAPDGKP